RGGGLRGGGLGGGGLGGGGLGGGGFETRRPVGSALLTHLSSGSGGGALDSGGGALSHRGRALDRGSGIRSLDADASLEAVVARERAARGVVGRGHEQPCGHELEMQAR